jgi:hypothetical protein
MVMSCEVVLPHFAVFSDVSDKSSQIRSSRITLLGSMVVE